MRIKRVFILASLWILVVVPNVYAQNDETGAIRALIEQVGIHMQAGNLAALDEIYSSGRGIHIIEGTGVNHGWEDYRDNHLKPELDAFENFQYRYFAIEPKVVGSLAYAAFRYELSADISTGHIDSEGRGTVVLEKINGQWRIVHSHTSGRRR